MKKENETTRGLKNNSNTILFIKTTQEMLETMPLEEISVRKIADRAGLHNSTIYLYFKDLDELLMLASTTYFQDYSRSLAVLSRESHSAVDTFAKIWNLFFHMILQRPKIFYHFFFGSRSNDLKAVLNRYYILFPDEKEVFSAEIATMYFGDNILDRNYKILKPLIYENTNVTTENIDMINDILIAATKYILEQKCKNTELANDQLITELNAIVSYTCGIE